MSYRDLATQAEIKRGLVFNSYFNRGADRVTKQNGVIVGSPTFTPVGVDLPGTAGNYVKYNIPSHLCDVQSSGNYLTCIVEFYPETSYTADIAPRFINTDGSGYFYIRKLNNAGLNYLRVAVGGAIIDDITTAEYGSLWQTGGRNQIVFSSTDGDTSIWLNGSLLTDSDATAYSSAVDAVTAYIGIYSDGSSNPFPGIISFVKIFKGPKFTTDEVSAYWNHKITARPEEAASYWFFDGARHDVANLRTLDITHNERHLTFGDGATSTTYPTKLAKHGYSFDGGDYLTGSTEPAITSGESLTLECEFTLDDVSSQSSLIGRSTAATNTNYVLRNTIDATNTITTMEFYFRESTDSSNRTWTTTASHIRPGRRYHVIFQHTFGTATSTRMFINGQIVAGSWDAGGGDQPLENAAWTVQVGARNTGSATQFTTGDIFHAGIWEERLTTIECYDLYVKALRRRNLI